MCVRLRRRVWSSSVQVGRQGFSGVGALVAAAEVASSAVCANFGSKEALFEEVLAVYLSTEPILASG
ncbi:TetR family transcriptional regulator [Streptomyces sp. NPDC057062]|uniref:TetR family transcriptional regulator n=1 Tax=unclassified Streptomyces TaxID=2593676 RepID=UPI0035AC18A3